MNPKEKGWVLSIDQASNQAGASLWHDGELVAYRLLSSGSKTDPFPRRMQFIVDQLSKWLDEQVGSTTKIDTVLFEGVRSRIVLCTVGAFCTIPQLEWAHVKEKTNFIESTSWKVFARRNGAQGDLKDIKGVKALSEIGFPLDRYPITSDDIADSILIYQTWASK